MPVYNRRSFLHAAIGSVLAQDFAAFELLVIDDGSTDGSADLLASIRDPRMRVVRHERNLGIPVTRNHGLDLARGEYLALLDSDDRACPHRLRTQLELLDRRPDLDVLGSWWTGCGDGRWPRPSGIMPVGPNEVAARLLFHCALSQSTIMARTAILRARRYPEDCAVSSDFALWVGLAGEKRLANLPRFLVRRTMHPRRITYEAAALVKRTKLAIFAGQLAALGVPYTDRDLEGHFLLLHQWSGEAPVASTYLEWASDWLAALAAANRRTRRYAEPTFTRVLAEVWLAACWQSARSHGWPVWRTYWGSPFGRELPKVAVHHAATFMLRSEPRA